MAALPCNDAFYDVSVSITARDSVADEQVRRENVPHEWVPCTHPEGRLYFYHPQKVTTTWCLAF